MHKLSNQQSGFGVIEIIIIVVVTALGFAGWYAWIRNTDNSTSSQQNYVEFEGTVTAMSNACHYDAGCSVAVDGKEISTGGGLTNDPQANTWGSTDADLSNGDHVKVKARNGKYGLTLQGCKECYITRGEARRGQ